MDTSRRMAATASTSASYSFAASPPSRALRSTDSVHTLIADACAAFERSELASAVSPLFPESCPWQSLADIPAKDAQRLQPALAQIASACSAYRHSLTATAGKLAWWLDASEDDIRLLAMRFARRQLAPGRKLAWAQSLLGAPVPGDCEASQLARLADARFWRRAIRVVLMREREHFFLRLRLVGNRTETYVSDMQLHTRLAQLKRQAQWMKETVLVPRYLVPGEADDGLLTLEQVASSPRTRFAKLYSFVKAMDAISIDQGLATAMLTLTLEPEWHPNPSRGERSWNGAPPREAHRSMARRWQSILRDLHRQGVGLSGLRVVEPHKDACPHWHVWLLYRASAEAAILSAVMRYFPHKLKVRDSTAAVGEREVIYDSPGALQAGAARRPAYAKEGAQVELARIDRSVSSGASYAMKYLLKTVDAGDTLNRDVGLLSEEMNPAQAKRRREHLETAKRVDAYRSLWGINAGQLFGVAKCLTGWDELRRLTTAPEHPHLRHLWTLARGTEEEGRIATGDGRSGDARAFLEALGGLAACRVAGAGRPALELSRLTEPGVNGYGEEITRARGVTLVQRRRERVIVGETVRKSTGEIRARTAWRTVKSVVASVRTRMGEWTLVAERHAALAIRLAEERFLSMPETSASGATGLTAATPPPGIAVAASTALPSSG